MQSLFSVRLDIDEHLSISFGVISDASGASYGVPEPPSLPDRFVRDSSGSSPVIPSSAGPPYSDWGLCTEVGFSVAHLVEIMF